MLLAALRTHLWLAAKTGRDNVKQSYFHNFTKLYKKYIDRFLSTHAAEMLLFIELYKQGTSQDATRLVETKY